ncbi:MAG: hypothetical protein PHI27_09745 [Eubacteriales bacterium]|nr:hypothetical protein [Eubacteriales bacterium]MDD3882525.1 hypothetical protein [Eubacteriales bacterium]MDD4512825.1 hypothetical protein [Eubacteriales bacterium]
MKSDVILVDRKNISTILDKVEAIALYAGMNRRDSSNMCLLAEEIITSVSHIMDVSESRLWMETSDEKFEIHMQIDALVTEENKKKFLEISKSGVNTKPRGFLARLGMALDNLFFSEDAAIAADGMELLGCETSYAGAFSGGYRFSYRSYISEVESRQPEERDELEGIEKTIIENIADDITVTARSHSVEIAAYKNLTK